MSATSTQASAGAPSEGAGPAAAALLETPLNALHRELGARMVAFAGYDMPVQYPGGILKEHRQVREAAGLFDVSHMGQALLTGDDPAAALENVVPGDIAGLAPGRIRYTLLLTPEGGIVDDLMAGRPADGDPHTLFLVVNAARKVEDFAQLSRRLAGKARLEPQPDRALLALQGPQAAAVMGRLAPGATDLVFMQSADLAVAGIACAVSRSGYTGEDGFEISVPEGEAEALARALLAEPEVAPCGLGARDSLRLEAGLCLYGHDIDETTTPIEANLAWTVPKRRREAADFPGADVVLRQLADGPPRRRVGLKLEGRSAAREGARLFRDDSLSDGAAVGVVTSGGFAPTVGAAIATGYVTADLAKPGARVFADVRGAARPAEVVKMPFVPPGYHRG
jgi:aminomethyltransferase